MAGLGPRLSGLKILYNPSLWIRLYPIAAPRIGTEVEPHDPAQEFGHTRHP
jgi:hypothetical protein